MRRGRWASIATGFAIVAATAVTAGCGGGASNALSLDPVAAAATKTQHAGAARIRFVLAFSGPRLPGKQLRLRGAGTIDGTSGELTFGLGSILRQAGIPGGVAPGATMAQLEHATVKEIFLEQNGDFVVYAGLGPLAAHLPGGKHWIKLDVSKLGKSAGIDLGTLLSGSQLQPGDLLSMLEAAGAKIRNLGSATVDGVATTHYHVTIDTAKALQAKGLTSPLLGGLTAEMPTVPEDVWIGQDGLVHRLRISLALAQSHGPLRLGMTMDLYDYGTNVTIAAPPGSDVFDATQMAEQHLLAGALR